MVVSFRLVAMNAIENSNVRGNDSKRNHLQCECCLVVKSVMIRISLISKERLSL